MSIKYRFLGVAISLVVLLGLGVALSSTVQAASLPATTCTWDGSVRTCELWAKAGVLTLPGGATIPIWGYTDQAGGTAQVPGPILITNQGETVRVILHNDLAEATNLSFPGLDWVPDLSGVAPGAQKTYEFVMNQPGTFLYEAGLLADGTGLVTGGERQAAMGLFGALIVRPAGNPNWAYDEDTSFTEEALLILNEFDPALNADPANFRLDTFAPQYWLLNGQAYPDTEPITVTAGSTVLLRIVNAGIEHRSLGLLGIHQQVVARDANLLPPYEVVAETIGAGETLDTLVSVPVSGTAGVWYPVFETAGHARNAGQTSLGGMLTFMEVGGVLPGPVAPVPSDVMLMPHIATGMSPVDLTAMFSDPDMGMVEMWEYFIETVGAPGTGISFTVPAPDMMVTVTATLSISDLAGLAPGMHTFYVRAKDNSGNWGPLGSASLHLIKAGPMITGMVLDPNPTNGLTATVDIQATGDARPMGPVNVVSATYSIDVTTTVPSPMALNMIAPVVSLNATIPQAVVGALTEGTHPVYIQAQDSLGNWGEYGVVNLYIDKTGPLAVADAFGPTPNNGYLGITPGQQYLRLHVDFNDPLTNGVNSRLVRAEGFIDTVGAPGSGFLFIADDSLFDSPQEPGFVHIPLSTIRVLDPGYHPIYFRARDAAGNWGPVSSVQLVVDKTGPAISDLLASPPQDPTSSILTGRATDPANADAPASNVIAVEWFVDTDPGPGNGFAATPVDGAFNSSDEYLQAVINVQALGLRPGDHTIYARAKDDAGNWGAVASTIFRVGPRRPLATIFANGFETAGGCDLTAWAQAVGGVAAVPEAAMGGTACGLAATIGGGGGQQPAAVTPAYVVDDTPFLETGYSARFFFHPNGTNTAGADHAILVGYSQSAMPIFGIRYEHSPDGDYEVRAWVEHSGGQAYTNWFSISNAPHILEVRWRAGTAAEFSFLIDDGATFQTLSGLDTSAYLVEEVWLGPSLGLADGMVGTEYLDEFSSTNLGAVYYYLPLVMRHQ